MFFKPKIGRTFDPVERRKTPWYRKSWVVISASVAVVSSLVGIVLKSNDAVTQLELLPSKVAHAKEQFLTWYHDDGEWAGVWSGSPEGVVDAKDMHLSEDSDLFMELTANQGQLGGMVGTKKLCPLSPLVGYALLEGKVSGNTGTVVVFDIVGGARRNYAQLTLRREDGVITVTPSEGHPELFSGPARLGRGVELDRNELDATWAEHCKSEREEFRRTVRRLVAERKASAPVATHR